MQRFVGPTERGAPTFEHGGHAGVMLGVRVEVKIAVRSGGEAVGVPAQERVGSRAGGEGLELAALGAEARQLGAEQCGEVRGIEMLGLFDVQGAGQDAAEGLAQPGLRRRDRVAHGAEGIGKEQDAGVLAPHGLAHRPVLPRGK